ncbi:carbamoyl-phosphate synthase (glutamine-hydrolyzing) large subunit [Rossellomorea marisflavi]|uniref:carbamoyl-phosphate synthase (glutamine-hydrolyzing) large subunit n=1 Tax=Rossellomorea marisflavi TaxID=189381 RepID=UPI001EE3918D|nr:carbamoyl-phosphate synthase (glutamine-hydrolyzing) large subunit [Rossellomorea marisflavi]UKS66241.1 carbamoyl-phosphate synthase (glutamine-hydrolyzing) large subunit [Rossellomorea marisflavi]
MYGNPKKILVIGSGPIVIGQAAEFDYSGTQACQALKEEGYYVLLVNSNPATIMTDKTTADEIYMEPLTVEYVKTIIIKEKPQALLATLGGQTALNIAYELDQENFLQDHQVTLLGVTAETIRKGEDRLLFKELMLDIHEPVPESRIVTSIKEAKEVASEFDFPLIVRPAYTLGGTGGGICHNLEELESVTGNGLSLSPIGQCLVERSIKGFKEVEMEVMRDSYGQAVIVCHMENLDPVGVHTGDSIVVSPCQTLSDKDYQMLRTSALKIISHLSIVGGCNIQFALHPNTKQYYIIEVNPRVSRSSALASKATGYPIAKIAAKLAVGKGLHEIQNPITKTTYACYEPVLDYAVVKIPVFPSEKFGLEPDQLGTQMKATGEVMAIGRTFEEALMKGIRSVSRKYEQYWLGQVDWEDGNLTRLSSPDHHRIFLIAEAFRRGVSVDTIFEVSEVDRYFLYKIKKIIDVESKIKSQRVDAKLLLKAKKMGLSDYQIALLKGSAEQDIYKKRIASQMLPVYKMVDTCAGEFESYTPYYYSTYEQFNDASPSHKEKIVILGSGPIQVGQGIEFDYATVHAIQAVKDNGFESIIINNNPETVSTDFSISDKLYFEPLTVEDVMNIIDFEQPMGVLVQFGGQLAINLAKQLKDRGVNVLGTSVESIEIGENRGELVCALEELNILHPNGETVLTINRAREVVSDLGYPLIVRPSYVIGGSDMEVITYHGELESYLSRYDFAKGNPLHIDQYIEGIELELDAICDGEKAVIPAVLEHIEQSGVHSGDSMAIYPPRKLGKKVLDELTVLTNKLTRFLKIKGLVNIQAVYSNQQIYLIEINLRSSRTLPFISKISDLNMAALATNCQLGYSLSSDDRSKNERPRDDVFYVKAPVFSFSKMTAIDPILTPEMKSTGEVIGYDKQFDLAVLKSFQAAGLSLGIGEEQALILVDFINDHLEQLLERLSCHTSEFLFVEGEKKGTGHLNQNIKTISLSEDILSELIRKMKQKSIGIVIDLRRGKSKWEKELRKNAVQHNIPLFTNVDTLSLFVTSLETKDRMQDQKLGVHPFYEKENVRLR